MKTKEKQVIVFRHVLVQGETGEAGTHRDETQGPSTEGMRQVERIIQYLSSFSPSVLCTGNELRHTVAGDMISDALSIPYQKAEKLDQKGDRSLTHERVDKMKRLGRQLTEIIKELPNRAMVFTSNISIEALLLLDEGELTLVAMEKNIQRLRTNPGNAVIFNGNAKPVARINLFW